MLLVDAEEKKFYRLVKIQEGKGIKLKLASMGLSSKVKVKVIKNDFFGPIILGIKAGRISLGRGLAEKIQVVEI